MVWVWCKASLLPLPLLLHDRERGICDLVMAREHGEADTQLLGQAMNAYFDSPEKS